MPEALYKALKRAAKSEYKSVSSLIRESVVDRIEERFTKEESMLIELGRKSFREAKGADWREVRRG